MPQVQEAAWSALTSQPSSRSRGDSGLLVVLSMWTSATIEPSPSINRPSASRRHDACGGPWATGSTSSPRAPSAEPPTMAGPAPMRAAVRSASERPDCPMLPAAKTSPIVGRGQSQRAGAVGEHEDESATTESRGLLVATLPAKARRMELLAADSAAAPGWWPSTWRAGSPRQKDVETEVDWAAAQTQPVSASSSSRSKSWRGRR